MIYKSHNSSGIYIGSTSCLIRQGLFKLAKGETKAEDGTEKIVACLDSDYQSEMDYLKQKIDAGADCIITQMFFDAEVFNSFVKVIRNNRKFRYAKQCYRQYRYSSIESRIIEVHPLDWEIAMSVDTERFYSSTKRRIRSRNVWKKTDINVRGGQ